MMLAFLPLAASAAPAAPAASAADCDRSRGSDIVVCGSRTGRSAYRLPKLPQRYDAKRIRAETTMIPGVQARAHVDSVDTPDGYRSNRMMVTFTLPF